MLKTYVAYFKDACLENYVDSVLEYAIENWQEYAQTLSAEHGVYRPSAVPDVRYLAKFPRVAVNLWLRGNKMELKECVPQPIPPKPSETRSQTLNGESARRTARSTAWRLRKWEDVQRFSYEEYLEEVGYTTLERHAKYIIGSWEYLGRPLIADMPHWALDIIVNHDPTYEERVRAALEELSHESSEPSAERVSKETLDDL